MEKIQSFPWAIKPIHKVDSEHHAGKHPEKVNPAHIEVALKQMTPAERKSLLAPFIEDELALHRANLEARLTKEMNSKLDKQLQVEIELAVIKVKEDVEHKEAQRKQKIEQLIAHIMSPEITGATSDAEQVLAFALVIVEKILAQKIASKPCYDSWVDSILGTTRGHNLPILNINQQDYNLLLEFDLITKLSEKVSEIKIKDVAHFSFELESIYGQSGHDSLAILTQLQAWLSERACD
ncbi:hypothetical protein Sden_0055 [Shewanella denitrificans OS217]|jgi:hypothetical protein|uniref:Uncharacterized protein n=1 Tax=Shewanella denitrificans (strain OS217 / ATCC BAA-1090 / DSM 15013) TaxID=318161 RepID=Q12T74_SHEDO|nr:hypothetical protein [Shewanella denitrificans]ABE53352.1 hypothetical protein Sden_0055 [Shewanella denitrificans OS217]